jgi:hypothetical protein
MKTKVFLVPPPTLYELKKQQQRAKMEQAEREYMQARKERGDAVHSEIKD